MRTFAYSIAVVGLVVLAGCVPRVALGDNPVSVSVTGENEVTAVFFAGEAVTDWVVALERVERVISTTHRVTCSAFGDLGVECRAPFIPAEGVTLVATAVDPWDVGVLTWYSTAAGDVITLPATP